MLFESYLLRHNAIVYNRITYESTFRSAMAPLVHTQPSEANRTKEIRIHTREWNKIKNLLPGKVGNRAEQPQITAPS
jgi:hypothetical protein